MAEDLFYGQELLKRRYNRDPYKGFMDYSYCETLEAFFEAFKKNGGVRQAIRRKTVDTGLGLVPLQFGHELHFWYNPVYVNFKGHYFEIETVYYFIKSEQYNTYYCFLHTDIVGAKLINFTGYLHDSRKRTVHLIFDNLDDNDLVDFMKTERFKKEIQSRIECLLLDLKDVESKGLQVLPAFSWGKKDASELIL